MTSADRREDDLGVAADVAHDYKAAAVLRNTVYAQQILCSLAFTVLADILDLLYRIRPV